MSDKNLRETLLKISIRTGGPIEKKEYVNVDVPKPKFEDTHDRTTTWYRKDLLAELNEITKGKRGLKTQILNAILDDYLRERRRKLDE
ncbi:hypothetical protein C7121_06235 [Paenibacillus glucanolyticus]|uniref:hypothetical protein n=1 Tax=Paenibacillus TaxID=44249 RepID=UPI0003E28BE6|nr:MULTISPECIES: hypothetical protein [Paenibacillus]ANA80167.1 hypothetical protein A3958_09300 [Paenibacillus glucanolyticus]AVV55766.1 hypothetical protein C7121_06235 [Paenibacillus glucanolyticus]ETT38577.1 hypothetical protein C169_13242 [Paenibacillus sp. FSL R5-808]